MIFETLVILFGSVLVPLVTSLIKQPSWSTSVKRVLALVVSVGFAVASVLADAGGFDFELLLTNFAVIYTLAQTTYLGLWEDSAPEKLLSNFGS